MATARVLVPVDETGRAPLLQALAADGLAVLVAATSSLVEQVARGGIDLVLLHATGPSALADLRALRAGSSVPVVVALRQGIASFEDYLAAGADDCVARGVSRTEVVARVRAVLRRRARALPGEVLSVGPFVMDLARHVFCANGREVHLPPKEFGLLELLLRQDGRVVGREQALDTVWGGPGPDARCGSDPTTVDVHIKRLRAKLEPDPARPRHLLTVRGLGYRLVA